MSCISNTGIKNNGVINFELEKKKEMEKRKIIRLLQVRQQSKDFANKIRENIQGETRNQKKKILEIERKQIQEEKLKELNHLKELYKTCLQTVGEGHREAIKQPNITLEKQEKEIQRTVKAAARGNKARKQHLKNEALHQQEIEAPIIQKRKTRNKENLRSFYISSLPKPMLQSKNTLKPLKPSDQSSSPVTIRQVLQDVPSNLLDSRPTTTKSLDIDNDKKIRRNLNVDNDSQMITKPVNNVLTEVNVDDNLTSSPKECCCGYIVCSCHNSPPILRRCQSASTLSNENPSDLEISQLNKIKTRSRSCSPRSVRALNYCEVGNLFESNQRSFVTITHHPTPTKTREEFTKPAHIKETDFNTKNNSRQEIKEKTEERSRKALYKEHLKKDFQKLLFDLGNLTRRKLILKSRIKSKAKVYQRERDILARNENKQKKLANSFETLLHTVKIQPSDQSQSSGSQHDKTSKVNSDCPPPTLNLALCQEVSMPRLQPIQEDSSETTDRLLPRTQFMLGSQEISYRSPPQSVDQSSHVSPIASVNKEPSGNVHAIVEQPQQPPKVPKHKKKCKRCEPSQTDSSSSSYCDPPDQLTPSDLELIKKIKKMSKKSDLKIDLRKYIEKLLTMRRESIDCLYVQQNSVYQQPCTVRESEDNLFEVSDYLADHTAEILNQNSHKTQHHHSSHCCRIRPNIGSFPQSEFLLDSLPHTKEQTNFICQG